VLVEECGALVTEHICVIATEQGQMEVLRWAISKRWPCSLDTWAGAVRRGGFVHDHRTMDLLSREKCPWSEAVWAAAVPYTEV